MTRTKLLAILLALATGWILRDAVERPVPVLPAANAQMIQDVTDLAANGFETLNLDGRPGSLFMTVSAQGDKLIFWRLEEGKMGSIMPTLYETQIFTAK